ncbi:MAG: hypothetical protein NC110_04725 [Ruminococcus sp.]|nr:hypothetical protein [Ruminococcus sp.]
MKNYIKTAVICLMVIIAASMVAVVCVNHRADVRNAQALPFSSEHALTADATITTIPPTTTPTAPPTTKPSSTQEKSVIDINSLTIIDLYPLSLAGGDWDVKHCQGVAVDKKNGYIYFSYTSMLVKFDWNGKMIGSVTGISGHLGDITFNEQDGKIYCGYIPQGKKAFYAAIFDADKITKTGMSPKKDIMRTVSLNEIYKDYSVDYDGDGKVKDGRSSPDHRYGCSGVDGLCFGPSFISPGSKKNLLTVCYGIYRNDEREDNDYQVLIQYDVSTWWEQYGQPYSAKEFHHVGPDSFDGKYFVYTGNTNSGVQTMEYFDELNLWFLNCYHGFKPQFNQFTLFIVDGDIQPVKKKLKGQPKTDKQYVLSLYQDGVHDKENDIYGWYSSYGVQGMAYIGDGLFYIAQPYLNWTGTKAAICYLNVWNPKQKNPFQISVDIGNDYSISKKVRVETTASDK